jgi:uncharacterized protein
MIIDLASIGASPKEINVVLDPSAVDLAGENGTLNGKVTFIGKTQRVAGKPHIHGTINADVSLDCTRCLEPVAKHLEIAFDDVFVDAGDEASSGEAEVAIADLDESLVPEGKIDLTEVVREQILLALPEQVFCREDCKGLCPKCGANRNLIDCKCADDEIDPRWAALRGLK